MRRARPLAALGGVFVVAAAIACAILLKPRDDERTNVDVGARPVPPLGDFDALEIEREGRATTLRRAAGGFVVSAPVASPADEPSVKAAFAALGQLDFIALVTDRRARQAELHVDAAAGVKVKVKRGDRALLELIVGKGSDKGTMVRVGAGDAVWLVAGNLQEIFDKPSVDWRDRTVSRFAADEAARIEVAARDGARIVLERGSEHGAAWRVRESSVPIGKLDVLVPRELLATLATLKASDFADGVPPAAAGLSSPSLTVGIGLRDGRAVTIQVGDPTDRDEVFVAVAGNPQIFRVKRFNVDRIARRPLQFRDKTLCDISDADVIAFGVTQGPRSYAVAARPTAGAPPAPPASTSTATRSPRS